MTSVRKHPPIICTDDGWALSHCQPPILPEDLHTTMIAGYKETPAALWLSIGDHELYMHETKVGEILGDPGTVGPGQENQAANIRHLIDHHGGLLTVMIDLCRHAGIQFFPRVRMNSHYDIEPTEAGFGRFRREHPELLIGYSGSAPDPESVEYGIRTGLDYLHAEVRAYQAEIICELFERFDVDGVELDFMRHPAFFGIGQGFQNRHLMTEMILQVRERILQASRVRGRDTQIAVRVPATLEAAARIGLDVELWMREGLVDIVVAGGGFIPYETPLRKFAAAAATHSIAVYGCIESTRHVDEKNLRAIASHFWHSGTTGIYLYNFYTMSPKWNRRMLNDLADPCRMSLLDKRYECDQAARFTTPYHCAYPTGNIESAFRHGSPDAQLPIVLDHTSSTRGHCLAIELADDIVAADKRLRSCTLTLRLEDWTDCALEVSLNGVVLPWKSANVINGGWLRQEIEAEFWKQYPCSVVEIERPGTSVEYLLPLTVPKMGENQIEIRCSDDLFSKNRPVLAGLEFLLEYN